MYELFRIDKSVGAVNEMDSPFNHRYSHAVPFQGAYQFWVYTQKDSLSGSSISPLTLFLRAPKTRTRYPIGDLLCVVYLTVRQDISFRIIFVR